MAHRDPKILCYKEAWSGLISVQVRMDTDHGHAYARDIIMEEVAEGDVIRPLLSLSMDSAQALMDSLWDCGLRPSEGAGSAGALAATQRHLEDMRTLVFERGTK